MIVVADSSPLIVLINIQLIDLLPSLFERITIPQAVAHELTEATRPLAVRAYFAAAVPWLDLRTPLHNPPIPTLHPGETEALNLAEELHADYVLIDERKAYRMAVARGLRAIGTVRVLELGADAGLVDLADAFDRLRQTDFWISEDILAESLRLHHLRKTGK